LRRVAVIGAGMCGLAISYFLSEFDVSLFDAKGIGGGASGVCGGLVHPRRGLVEVPAMVCALEKAWPFFEGHLHSPLVRMAKEGNVEAGDYTEGRIQGPAILIERGGALDIPAYLQSLFAKAKCTLICRQIEHLEELADYDAIVIAAGAKIPHFIDISCEVLYGRALIYDVSPPSHGVLGDVYFAPQGAQLAVGATYEHKIEKRHLEKLRRCATLMMPELGGRKPCVVQGARLSGPGRRPFAHKVNARTWAIGGMGGRGLVYHVAYAEKLAKEIAQCLRKG